MIYRISKLMLATNYTELIAPSGFCEVCPLVVLGRVSAVPYTCQVWWKSIDICTLSPGGEGVGLSRADSSIKICPQPDLLSVNSHTKFGESPLVFARIVVRRLRADRQTDVRLTDRRTDRHTDVQRETIIPRYHVAGYN